MAPYGRVGRRWRAFHKKGNLKPEQAAEFYLRKNSRREIRKKDLLGKHEW